VHWFETDLLALEENLVGLMAVNRDLLGQAETWDRSDRTILDMDASESPAHGQQEGNAYTATSRRSAITRCFCSMTTAIAWPRSCARGTSPAEDWDELLVAEIDRQQAGTACLVTRRRGRRYEALEAPAVGYAIRIPANKHLELAIEDILFRSLGRPSRKPLGRYKGFQY
jgi:hypothetical protein